MTKEKFYNNRKELVLKLWNLTRKKAAIAISKHNTILGLRNSITKEISHLIDMKKENGLIVANGNIDELYVSRYEPSVAKEWLKEKLSEQDEQQKEDTLKKFGFFYEKCLLSINELEKLFIKNAKEKSKFCKIMYKLNDKDFNSLAQIKS